MVLPQSTCHVCYQTHSPYSPDIVTDGSNCAYHTLIIVLTKTPTLITQISHPEYNSIRIKA